MPNLKPRIAHLVLFASLVAGASSYSSISKAEEIDLAAVTASIVAALQSAEKESRTGNEFVLPLRTNAELERIVAMCDMAAEGAAGDAMRTEICGEAVDPIDLDDSLTIEAAIIRYAQSG